MPSLTEAIAYDGRELLVGATDWCTHPADLDVARVGGTKNPDVAAILALRPDVVIANDEENKPEHIAQLREQGVAVYVTAPTTVDEAFTSLSRMLPALGLPISAWIEPARAQLATPIPQLEGQRMACFIWRRPWMVLGRDTFAGDMLRRLGLSNVYADSPERYPRADPDLGGREADLIVLPDEPYAFSASDGPEAFSGRRCALVSGRHLTWYGPSMVEARAVLGAALTGPVRAV
ncbi:helical backbone metal receptor [Epidermidibacterium keratini]